jgi:hypothetical protein
MSKVKKNIIQDELSDLDDSYNDNETDNNDTNTRQDEENALSPEFTEKVLLYIKYDDLIREKMAEIKELKNQKKPCEQYILSYLESKDAPFVKVKNGKLIKNKSETKGSLKLDIIKTAIMEGVKNEKIVKEDNILDVTSRILDLMEAKRPKMVRLNIKRTFQKV